MNKFSQRWADQLRAGALQIAEQAEMIVGDLELNRKLNVTICLGPGDGTMECPVIEIRREILSRPMLDVWAGRATEQIREQEEETNKQ